MPDSAEHASNTPHPLTYACGRCGAHGHNRRSCADPDAHSPLLTGGALERLFALSRLRAEEQLRAELPLLRARVERLREFHAQPRVAAALEILAAREPVARLKILSQRLDAAMEQTA